MGDILYFILLPKFWLFVRPSVYTAEICLFCLQLKTLDTTNFENFDQSHASIFNGAFSLVDIFGLQIHETDSVLYHCIIPLI
jgi:hypothetical protein